MNFYIKNYTDWFDNKNSSFACTQFIDEFRKLTKNHFRFETSFAIAKTIISRMSEEGLFYHTPPHIVNLLQSAKELNLELESWEIMSIFFHDSVYIPRSPAGMSENCSAVFFQALMKPYINKPDGTTDYNELLKISTSITMTASHLETLEKTDPMWFRVLDLDLLGFALPAKQNDYVNNLVKKEFLAFGVTEEDYDKGRKVFLEKLISKGYIFRTEFFRDKFEAIAMENIKNGINGI